jgi:hypothetical protein
MKIKVVANRPNEGQDPITHMIGKEFDGYQWDRENGEIKVNCQEFDGAIVLNNGEWERIKE